MNKPQPIPKLIPSIPLPFEEVMKDVLKVKPPDKGGKPCECGCGKFPKGKKSRFLPGHDLRKAYSDRG